MDRRPWAIYCDGKRVSRIAIWKKTTARKLLATYRRAKWEGTSAYVYGKCHMKRTQRHAPLGVRPHRRRRR